LGGLLTTKKPFQPPPLLNKTYGFPATTLFKQNLWLSSHHPRDSYKTHGSPATTQKKQVNMALQPSSQKCSPLRLWLSSHHPTNGCPAITPQVQSTHDKEQRLSSLQAFFHHQNGHSKINRKFNRKINREINRNLHVFMFFFIFSFQSRNQSRNFVKTTILLKKNGFQSQIEFVLKSIVRLNFFNLGAFGFELASRRNS